MASILAEPSLDTPAGAVRAASAWKASLVTLAACTAWALVCYWPAAVEMVRIWARTTTFNHGFVVLPIALWLAWRQRPALAGVALRPAAWPLVAIALLGMLALAGVLARVNVLPQFALVATLVLTVPAVLGVRAARVLAFPLAFLFFAVPMGDFLLPRLMDWTADFTVAALRATGIPVYKQGLVFVIPSGSWSVVEACSGVRYLIASLMVGTLYAFLMYRSTARRVAFVACAAAVPIVANWMRAYLIVLLGHLSDNRLAVGIDHLIYGWIFFGVVVLAMFWVGARWREDELPAGGAAGRDAPVPIAAPGAQSRMRIVAGALALIVGVAGLAQWRVLAHERGQAGDVALAPLDPGHGWEPVAPVATTWTPRFTAPSGSMQASFARGTDRVGVYVAYYRHQTATRKLVSTENAIVAIDSEDWSRTLGPRDALTLGSVPVAARAVRIVSTRDRDDINAWQFYWIDGRLTASDVLAKAWTAWSELASSRDDSAVVIVYAHGNGVEARQSVQRFLADAGPALLALLDTARRQP